MMSVAFCRSRATKIKVAGDFEFIELQLKIRGQPNPETGMIINLIHVDETLDHLGRVLESGQISTIKDAVVLVFEQAQVRLKSYLINDFELVFKQPQFGYLFSYDGIAFSIELHKHMRYQMQFGQARVRFSFDAFYKLSDRERRQDYWQFGMADSAVEALKGKFPYADRWEFHDHLSQEIQSLERIISH